MSESWLPAGHVKHLADTIRQAQRLDRAWMGKVPESPGDRELYTSWMPFPVPAFLSMLFEALPEVPGDWFLDVGCGPGSKMLLARDVAGLRVHGIERSDAMASAARVAGLDADTADAANWAGYGDYDLVWLNRPARDPGTEAALEQKVMRDMAPGAVLMCANLEAPPPASWYLILDDWEFRRGIWSKPAGIS